jgi:hypothetical protein
VVCGALGLGVSLPLPPQPINETESVKAVNSLFVCIMTSMIMFIGIYNSGKS